MRPTHVLLTLDRGRYLIDLSDPADREVIDNMLGTTGGVIKITHMVEDKSVYDKVTYVEKVAILACRAIIGLEEV